MEATVLVTGATGFIGRRLCQELLQRGYKVRAGVRTLEHSLDPRIAVYKTGSIDGSTDWSEAVTGADYVIHLAARAHVLKETTQDPLALFRKVNTEGTVQLANASNAAGVRRFIFISTVGVMGDHNDPQHPFVETQASAPTRPYAIAKWEAEQQLQTLALQTRMEQVIIRPPLVYGPHAPGNFQRLVKLIHRGLPLPLGGIHNTRSMIGLDNLVDFIIHAMVDTRAAAQTFLISDDETLSTTALIERIAHHLNRRALLIPVPAELMTIVGKFTGKSIMMNQLWGSLVVDASKAQRLLQWTAPFSTDDQLRKAVTSYFQ